MIDEHDKQLARDSKEARRITRLFKETFDNDEARECLSIIENMFNLHVPSMPAVGFEPLQAAYMDGQKSIIAEIKGIKDGKYLQPKQENNE
jgi:hypothetical protein